MGKPEKPPAQAAAGLPIPDPGLNAGQGPTRHILPVRTVTTIKEIHLRLPTSNARAYAAAGTLLLLSASLVSAQGAAVTLALTPKKGDSYRYRSEIKATLMGADVLVTSVEKHQIDDVATNGEVTLTQAQEENKVTVMGMEQQSPASPPITFTASRTGRVVNVKALPPATVFSEGVMRVLYHLGRPLFAAKQVAVGDTWETELENAAMAGKKFIVRTTYQGTEKKGDKELWKVHQVTSVELPGAVTQFDHTFWTNPTSGMPVRIEGSVKELPTQFGNMSWTETTDLVP